jgi:hypothetical protein
VLLLLCFSTPGCKRERNLFVFHMLDFEILGCRSRCEVLGCKLGVSFYSAAPGWCPTRGGEGRGGREAVSGLERGGGIKTLKGIEMVRTTSPDISASMNL